MTEKIEGTFVCKIDGEKLCVTVETNEGVHYTMTIPDFKDNEIINDFVKTAFSR